MAINVPRYGSLLGRSTIRFSIGCLSALLFPVLQAGAANESDPGANEARQAARPQVWLAPDQGSCDYAALFPQTDRWATAKNRTAVFHFHELNVLDDSCSVFDCNLNTLSLFKEVNAFSLLSQWGMKTAIGVGVLKSWSASDPNIVIARSKKCIRNVRQAGGKVAYLAMDEPLKGAQESGRECYSGNPQCLAWPATYVATYVRGVRASFPTVRIGLIEPYPEYSAATITQWVSTLNHALKSQDPGDALPFFQLDFDLRRARNQGVNITADLRKIRDFCGQQGYPLRSDLHWS